MNRVVSTRRAPQPSHTVKAGRDFAHAIWFSYFFAFTWTDSRAVGGT
jgi:hypothetical protein